MKLRGVSVLSFSVIIPTYNSAPWIGAALRSVLAQRYEHYEIIVIDDGSTDATRQVLAAFGDSLLYLSQTNGGPGSARNLALAHASGDYVAFLDSDDLLFPWALETYAELVERHGSPALVLSRPFAFQRKSDLAPLVRSALNAEGWADYLQAAPAYYPVSVAGVVRTDVMRRHGGFTPLNQNSEEQDLYLRMGEEAGFVFVHAPQLYAYRSNEGSRSADVAAHYRGLEHLLDNERRAVYPGGRARHRERSIVLTRIIKYNMTQRLKYGQYTRALQVYARSLPYLWQANRKAAFGLFGIFINRLKGVLVRSLKSGVQRFAPGFKTD